MPDSDPAWYVEYLAQQPAAAPPRRPSGGVDFDLARKVATKYQLPPSLLAGIWDFESGGNPGAVNKSSGATGLGQVMPRERGFPDRPTQAELLDPETNAEWSARILKSGLDRYGSEDKALAAYLGAIDSRGNITGAVDANGTGGNQYIQTVRQRQQRYTGADAPQAPQRASPAVDDSDPAWFKDAVARGLVGAAGGQAAPLEGGRGGTVWPVVGQKPGAVNNPFGAGQSRAAGTTVQLPSQNVGADLTARHGDTVVAPVSGTVVEVFDAPNERDRNLNHGWGGMTLLQGDDGFQYRLSHAQPGSIGTRPGQRVQAGQYLQRVGVSGNTTGPHLDLEKFSAPGKFVDPVSTSGAVSSPSRGAAVSQNPRGLTAEPGDPQWFKEYVAQAGRR